MTKLHYNFKDVFRAARFGFSAKKMWVQFLGLLIGVVGYLILAYIAFLVGTEHGFAEVWNKFRFIPLPFGVQFGWLGWIFMALGFIWFVAVNLLTHSADIPLEPGRHVTCIFYNERADLEEDVERTYYLPLIFK